VVQKVVAVRRRMPDMWLYKQVHRYARTLQQVLVQMCKQMQHNAHALQVVQTHAVLSHVHHAVWSM
jgi:hypothetical protein